MEGGEREGEKRIEMKRRNNMNEYIEEFVKRDQMAGEVR